MVAYGPCEQEKILYLMNETFWSESKALLAGLVSEGAIVLCSQFAIYFPCSAHSLNLVGVCAVESCIGAIFFFR